MSKTKYTNSAAFSDLIEHVIEHVELKMLTPKCVRLCILDLIYFLKLSDSRRIYLGLILFWVLL